MSKTINGKPITKIMEELQADFPEDVIQTRSYDGIPYMSADILRNRLDEVVGVGHYNELYSDAEVVQVKESYATKVKCRLEFLDDDFEVCLVKEANGGSNIAFPKDDNKDELSKTQSLPNDVYAAGTDAFKKICKNLLHIGERQIEKAKNGVAYAIKINSLKAYGANIFGYGTLQSEEGEKQYNIAIFKSEVEAFKKAYGDIDSAKGKVITFYGKEGTDPKGNPQLVFKKVAKSDTPSAPKSQATQPAKTQQTPKTEPTASSSNKMISMKLTTLSPVKMQGHTYYCEVKDEGGKKYNLCFSKENLPENSKWQNFQKMSADGITVIVDCTVSESRIEFLGFTKKK